jgi:hypothetical protein
MLRLGIGAAVIVVAYFSFFGWLKKHDAAIYAEESVSPTPDDPKALAALCEADPYCRDRKAPK